MRDSILDRSVDQIQPIIDWFKNVYAKLAYEYKNPESRMMHRLHVYGIAAVASVLLVVWASFTTLGGLGKGEPAMRYTRGSLVVEFYNGHGECKDFYVVIATDRDGPSSGCWAPVSFATRYPMSIKEFIQRPGLSLIGIYPRNSRKVISYTSHEQMSWISPKKLEQADPWVEPERNWKK